MDNFTPLHQRAEAIRFQLKKKQEDKQTETNTISAHQQQSLLDTFKKDFPDLYQLLVSSQVMIEVFPIENILTVVLKQGNKKAELSIVVEKPDRNIWRHKGKLYRASAFHSTYEGREYINNIMENTMDEENLILSIDHQFNEKTS